MMGFFEDMLPYAGRASQATNIPTSVILAQWANESAYGQSDLSKRANNLAGIKYWGDGYINDGQSGMYANYSSVDRFTDAWIQFMGGNRYQPVRDAGSPEDTINALADSGYAEDPNYKNVVSGILTKNNLTQYDSGDYSAASTSSGSSLSNLLGGLDQKKNNDMGACCGGNCPGDGGLKMKLDGTDIVNYSGSMGLYQIGGIVLDGVTYVPIRSVANAEGKDVDYDEESRTVNVK